MDTIPMNSPHFPGTRALVTAALVALFPGCMTVDTKPTIENRFSGPGPIVSAPAESADRAYLGLRPEVTTFQLSDVQSELIVVEKFDMHCHSCQTAAKYVRELFEIVHRSSGIPRDPESLLDRILEAARREGAFDESDASFDVDDTCDPDNENCLPDSEFTAGILDA